MTYIALPTKVAQLVRVEIKEDEKLFTATSPDLNVFVTGGNLDDHFHAGIERAIRENFSAMGQQPPMTVMRANHPMRASGYWYFVAIPQCALDAREHNETTERADG